VDVDGDGSEAAVDGDIKKVDVEGDGESILIEESHSASVSQIPAASISASEAEAPVSTRRKKITLFHPRPIKLTNDSCLYVSNFKCHHCNSFIN
jgi:hypothetical protein